MSCQPFSELNDQAKNQLACNLAALLLHDAKVDLTSENILKVVTQANIKLPEYWPSLLSKALDGKNLDDFMSVSGGGAQQQAQVSSAPAKAEQKEEKPKTQEQEEDVDMGGFFE